MADQAFRCEQPMAVQVIEGGLVVAFANMQGGQLGLFFDPGAADETGRRLREAARTDAGVAIPNGHVARIQIAPPTSVEECADLVLALSDGQEVTLSITLADLARLAGMAESALAAVEPTGRG